MIAGGNQTAIGLQGQTVVGGGAEITGRLGIGFPYDRLKGFDINTLPEDLLE